jgi:hypothetical protein
MISLVLHVAIVPGFYDEHMLLLSYSYFKLLYHDIIYIPYNLPYKLDTSMVLN